MHRPIAHYHLCAHHQLALHLSLLSPFPFIHCFFQFLPFFLIALGQTCWYHTREHFITTAWPCEDTPSLVQMRISLPWRRQEDWVALKLFVSSEKRILRWTADQFYPRALHRTGFEKQMYFATLANLCLQGCLGFIIVIQVFTKIEVVGVFFLFFMIQNSWKSIWKVHLYVCPDVEPPLGRPAGIKVSFV